VLIGFVNLPAAAVLQILVPLVIFRDLVITSNAYQPVPFAMALVLGTIIFTGLLLFFRHTFIPLLFLAGFALLSFFSAIIAENRIEQMYGGAP
jgi:hypothetical protein